MANCSFVSSFNQSLAGENSVIQQKVSRKMSLIIGARRHLEWGHEKYIMDIIQSHPAQVKYFLLIFLLSTPFYCGYSFLC